MIMTSARRGYLGARAAYGPSTARNWLAPTPQATQFKGFKGFPCRFLLTAKRPSSVGLVTLELGPRGSLGARAGYGPSRRNWSAPAPQATQFKVVPCRYLPTGPP